MEKKITILIIGICINFASIFAQKSLQVTQASAGKGLIYDREHIYLGEIGTRGLQFAYQWGKLKTYYKTTYYELGIGYLTNPKETKTNISASNFAFGSSYVFGKQNSLIKIGLISGKKFFLTEKDLIKGVAVGYSFGIGPQLGLLKPYYIVANGNIEKNNNYIKYSESTKDIFYDSNRIGGAAPFVEGLSELKLLPSLHAKLGLHFDWGAFDEYVRALEIGFSADVFLKKVPIMIENAQNQQYFINFYANLQLGKRK